MSAPTPVFDRAAVRRHRDRAAATVRQVAPVLDELAERLLDRLDDIKRGFTQALDVGGRGSVAPRLRARGIHTVCCDLSPRMAAVAGAVAVAADETRLPFAPGSFDLVVASLSLHWVDDLPGCLIQLRQALRPDGLLLASLPVLGTLGELRTALADAEMALRGGASPRISPFPTPRDCADLMQRAGFALPVVDLDEVRLAYTNPLSVLRDLRHAGEANAALLRDRRIAPRALFPEALAALETDATGMIHVSVRVAMLTGWAPAPSQPRPAARGSATHSLAQALTGQPITNGGADRRQTEKH